MLPESSVVASRFTCAHDVMSILNEKGTKVEMEIRKTSVQVKLSELKDLVAGRQDC